jgi:Cytochrome C and Quinol oxidase polypeptide I
VLGLSVAEIGAIAAGIEIIIAILRMRTPGMTLSRMPLFAWTMLVTAFMILFALTTLIVGSLLLELDRGFGMAFFDPDRGGSFLLWQHLFWIFGHPEVYIQFLPAALWDQDDLHRGEPRTESLLASLASWPLTWRAALITDTTTAVALGAVLIVVTLVFWHRSRELVGVDDELRAFEQAHDIPVHVGGSHAVGASAMGLVVLVMATAFAILLFGLLLPPGRKRLLAPDIDIRSPARRVRRCDPFAPQRTDVRAAGQAPSIQRRSCNNEPAHSFALEAIGAAVAVELFDLANRNFGTKDHAYGSVYFVMSGSILAITLAGLVMLAMSLTSRAARTPSPRMRWVPGGAVFVIAALALTSRWLRSMA